MFGLENYVGNEYLRVFIIIIVGFLILRILLYIGQKIFLRIASKTKTDLDDKLIKRTSTPLTLLAFLAILRISLGEMPWNFNEAIVIKLIWTLLVIVLAYVAYIVLDLLLIRILSGVAKKSKTKIDESILYLFDSIMKVAFVALSLIYILHVWGIEITPLLAGLGIAGLAVALALQPVLSNIFSGASMVFDRTIGVGDMVYLDNASIKGYIQKIGLRSTRIKTFDNEYIIVPNNKLAESTIQNIALPDPTSRAVIPFSVAYGSDIDEVKKIVLAEINKISEKIDEPKPLVRFSEMGNSSLNFKAYFYVASFEDRFSAIDKANTLIYNALNKHKIGIPFPQMDVHLKK